MSIAVMPFTDEHVEPASRLLAAQHRRMRERQPLLADAFSNSECWVESLNTVCSEAVADGLAAMVDDVYAGHLIWKYFDVQEGSFFSPFVAPGTVEASLAGFAIDPAYPVVARRLYAAASDDWIADGRGTHELRAPAAIPEVLDELYGLGFGRLAAAALRETSTGPAPENPAGVTFRQAAPGDEDAVRRLASDLWHSFTEAPINFPSLPGSIPDLHAHADRYLSDPASPVWLAERDGQAEAMQLFLKPESDDWLLGPPISRDGAIYLFWASTSPEARGSGVHTSLLGHKLVWARNEGYHTVALHFLSASRASEYWQRQGFQPLQYILARRVDPRALPVS